MKSDTWDFFRAKDNMKIYIKEQLRKNAYPKTNNLKPLSQSVKIKGAHKKCNTPILSESYFSLFMVYFSICIS